MRRLISSRLIMLDYGGQKSMILIFAIICYISFLHIRFCSIASTQG